MKNILKNIIITIFITIVFFAFGKKTQAQTLTFDRAYQDYQYNLSVYQEALSSYQNAKNAYLANQTLALKDQARQKTFIFLTDRDGLIIAYLTALRTKIVEINGLSTDEKSGIFGKIDNEVAWYQNHKKSYGEGDSPQDLFNKNKEAERKYKESSLATIDASIADISLGESASLRSEHENIYSDLKNIINDGVSKGILTMSPFNQWYADIDTTVQNLKSAEDLARSQGNQIFNQTYGEGGFTASIQTISDAKKLLFQLNEFLTEVVNYIKNQK